MKINKIKTHNFKLLKLKLIKTKIYKEKYSKFIKIEDTNIRLKKSLHIIYKYHINNKKILFIGTPVNIDLTFKNLLQKTKHILIPTSLWLNGIITNQFSCFKYLFKNQKTINNKISKILFKIKNKSDLIVIFNTSDKISIINEGYSARIPIISINCNLEMTDEKSSYKVPGNFELRKKKIRDTFFYSILTAVFKKTNKNIKQSLKKKSFHKNFKNKKYKTFLKY
jgi:ribosomal protein S2